MHLIYKQLRLYINLHIKKLFYRPITICIPFIFLKSFILFKFDVKSINQEFLLFCKLLNKQSRQYFII